MIPCEQKMHTLADKIEKILGRRPTVTILEGHGKGHGHNAFDKETAFSVNARVYNGVYMNLNELQIYKESAYTMDPNILVMQFRVFERTVLASAEILHEVKRLSN